MAAKKQTRYVDVSNPSLSVDCPRCGLRTARFIDHCRNCSYKLWPSSVVASAAFKAWRAADPSRAEAARVDLDLPRHDELVIDYDARAHDLGIHMPPPSNWPFVICFGLFFLSLAAIPLGGVARISMAVFGGIIFLVGVVGWVVVDDTRMFPTDATTGHEAHE